MRLFIAVCLSDAMRAAVREVQDQFLRHGVRGNYSRPENLHLTLAFIGEYPDPERVLEAMESVPFAPFALRLDGLGAYGDLWWVGLERIKPLMDYVSALRHALSDADIPFDHKRFSPHITLVRRAQWDSRAVAGIVVPEAGMMVEHISLMRSDRGKAGMIYTEIL